MIRKSSIAFAALAATFATGAFATGAFAADLPSAAPAPAPYVAAPVPVFTWTGFYIGVNAGAAFNGSLHPVFYPGVGFAGVPAPLRPGSTNTAGFTGGGQLGYNWQVNQFVFGLEGDLDYLDRANVNGTYGTTNVNGGGFYTLAGGRRDALFGTIRGRVGWAVDRALFYVTGGVAFGGNSAPNSIAFSTTPGGAACATCTYTANGNHNSDVGEVLGGGVEYAFTPNWTGKVEYLHTFYNNRTVTYTNSIGQTFASNGYKFDTNIIRVGLNYKF
jgi:outer membrane immunogenic protein